MPEKMNPTALLTQVMRQKMAAATALVHETYPHMRKWDSPGASSLFVWRTPEIPEKGLRHPWSLQGTKLLPVYAITPNGFLTTAYTSFRVIPWEEVGYEDVLRLHELARYALAQRANAARTPPVELAHAA